MSDQSMELMHELLKQMNGRFDSIENRFNGIESRLTAIEHHMKGLVENSLGQGMHYDRIARRLSRLENRLELTGEGDTPDA